MLNALFGSLGLLCVGLFGTKRKRIFLGCCDHETAQLRYIPPVNASLFIYFFLNLDALVKRRDSVPKNRYIPVHISQSACRELMGRLWHGWKDAGGTGLGLLEGSGQSQPVLASCSQFWLVPASSIQFWPVSAGSSQSQPVLAGSSKFHPGLAGSSWSHLVLAGFCQVWLVLAGRSWLQLVPASSGRFQPVLTSSSQF